MGATAAWVYQKWAVNVSESVFRVFGVDLDPIFEKFHQKFHVSPPSAKPRQGVDKSYAPHFWLEDQTFAELISKMKKWNHFGISLA